MTYSLIYKFRKKNNKFDNLDNFEVINVTKDELLDIINSYLRKIIYYCSMDEFIQNKTNFNMKKYQEYIQNFKNLFDEGKYNIKNSMNIAFEYIKNQLNDCNIYDENLEEVGEDILSSIAKLRDSESNNYDYVDKFINYLNNQVGYNFKLRKEK